MMTKGIFLNPSSRCLLVVVWSALMASMLKSTLLVPFIYTHAVVAKVLKRFLNKTSVGCVSVAVKPRHDNGNQMLKRCSRTLKKILFVFVVFVMGWEFMFKCLASSEFFFSFGRAGWGGDNS